MDLWVRVGRQEVANNARADMVGRCYLEFAVLVAAHLNSMISRMNVEVPCRTE